MKFIKIILIIFLFGKICQSQNLFAKPSDFQLSKPIIQYENLFFEKENRVQAQLSLKRVELHYTKDGSEPTINSPIFNSEIILTESATLKVKAFHPEFQSSPTVSTSFLKLPPPISIKNIELKTAPNPKYAGNGKANFLDRKKGTADFHSKDWLGFSNKEIEVLIELEETQALEKLTMSILRNHGAWIFLPEKVEILGSEDGEDFELLSIEKLKIPNEAEEFDFHFLEISLKNQEMNFIKILIHQIPEIPSWHAGKGHSAWLFLDEIILE